MNIYYLGPQGTFSHTLASQFYTKDEHLVATNSFAEIVELVQSNKHDIGILPIENSTTSNVHENLDYLFLPDIYICDESYLAVRLHLIGNASSKLNDISTVLSHPKALEQCSSFIKEHNMQSKPAESTAAAIERIRNATDTSLAAIGSTYAARFPELQVIEKNIGNQSKNVTRFLHITSHNLDSQRDHCTKASIVFKTPHKSGALASVLSSFASKGINLTKIESQPIPGSLFEYRFWVDLELQDSKQQKNLFTLLDNETLEYHIIGFYVPGRIFES